MASSNVFHPSVMSQVSHELRIPITGILGMAHFLSSTALTPQQQEYLQTIESLANRLLSLEDKLCGLLSKKKRHGKKE